MLPGFTSLASRSRRGAAKGSSSQQQTCPMLGSRDTEGISAYERERNKNVQQNRQVPSP